MKQKFHVNPILASLLLATAMLLSACASAPERATGAPEAQPEPEPQAIEIEPWEGDGMDIPLDGSSLEAFEASLARVEAHTTPEQYQGLTRAINYLLVYDLGAKGDRATLASRLDGLTPADVFKRVGWRRPAPGSSPADKTAADAKIIDS